MIRRLYMTILILVTVGCVIGGTVSHAIGFAVKAGRLFSGSSASKGGGSANIRYFDDVEKFSSVYIDLNIGNLVVKSGTSYSAEWSELSGNDRFTPTITISDGDLTVTQDGGHFNLSDLTRGSFGGGTLTITLPGEARLENIVTDMDMGDCTISGVSAESGEFSMNMGNMEITGASFSTLDINCDMGNASLENIKAAQATLSADMGNIDMTHFGDFTELDLNASLGNITVSLDKPVSELTLDLESNMGSVTINGGKARNHISSGSGEAFIYAEANMGNIELTTR